MRPRRAQSDMEERKQSAVRELTVAGLCAAENQRGEVTAPGQATVMLPSRDPRVPWFTDGSSLQLRTTPRSEGIPPILPE